MVSQKIMVDGAVAWEGVASGNEIIKKMESESEALANYKIDNYHLLDFDRMLDDIYYSRQPISADYVSRRDLVHCLNAMAKEIYGNSKDVPVMEAYGSFVMDMFSKESDLDLSINFGKSPSELPRDKKIQILRRFAKKLRFLQSRGHVTRVETILSAKVPIVKFLDEGSRVECDLSVENNDGVLKSQLIHIISRIDDRFKKLSVLMKSWAKSHDINSSRDQTLNSLSIISVVAFHLQTREPPILPPFSLLFKDGTDPPDVVRKIRNFLNWGRRNRESLGRLFITLLIKLKSAEHLWNEGLCVSLLDASWIFKTWKTSVGSIRVEDFTDRSQNVARAVGGQGAKRIYTSIQRSNKNLLDFFNGRIGGSHLKHILFGSSPDMVSLIPPTIHPAPNNIKKQFYDHPEHHHAKRSRLSTKSHTTAEVDTWGEREGIFGGCSGKGIRYDESYIAKSIRYDESYIAPETVHYAPQLPLQNPLEIPSSLGWLPFHGASRGPMVPHLQGPFSVEGPSRSLPYQPLGLRPEYYVGGIDPAPYDRASYGHHYHGNNYSEPYSRRLFH